MENLITSVFARFNTTMDMVATWEDGVGWSDVVWAMDGWDVAFVDSYNACTLDSDGKVRTDLYNDIGGRMFFEEAPNGAEFPYCVFNVVSAVPQRTFTENFNNVLLQFALFSSSKRVSEMTTMYKHLLSLYDDAFISVTGNTVISQERVNLIPSPYDASVITKEGGRGIREWSADYEILLLKD